MVELPIEHLESELQERAFARNAELVVDTDLDGSIRAAFEQLVDPMAPSQDVIRLEVTAPDRRTALERLLSATEDEE